MASIPSSSHSITQYPDFGGTPRHEVRGGLSIARSLRLVQLAGGTSTPPRRKAPRLAPLTRRGDQERLDRFTTSQAPLRGGNNDDVGYEQVERAGEISAVIWASGM